MIAERSADKLRLRLRSLLRRGRVEEELDAELGFHLDQLIAENVAAGMSPREARHSALRSFGGVTQIQEECREMWGIRFIDQLGKDLSYAVRTLLRSPVFTLVAVLSLALGIGANTAIFSLINALLLRELPVRDPQTLVAVGEPTRVGSLSQGDVQSDLFSYPMYRELRQRNRAFSGLLASGRTGRLNVGDPGAAEVERVRGRLVSGNYFEVLGVPALLGRTFSAADESAPGASPYIVVSYDYWQQHFAGDGKVLGRTLTLNGSPFTVIGVTPRGFVGDVVGTATEVWIPLSMQPQVNPGRDFLEQWGANWLLLLGRLEPGSSLAGARAQINSHFRQVVTAGLIPENLRPAPDRSLEVPVSAGGAGFSYMRQQFERPLFTLLVIVALVLVMASVNVANLLLERAVGRRKEITIRLALGAGRTRLIRQLLTESLLLSALGGALGLFFAFWAGKALLALVGASPTALDLRPDLPILLFTLGVSLLTGALFGLAPALRATRVELAPTLKESSRSLAGRGAGGRWQLGQLLVVVQFALSLLLLVGAGLFVRTLRNLERLDLGLARGELLMATVDPVGAGYTGGRLETFPGELLARLEALPNVTGATFSENGIFSGTESASTVQIEGFKPVSGRDESVNYDVVGPRYFEVLGIPIREGRGIGPGDTVSAPKVVVVNDALARRYFPGRNTLGRRLTIPGENEVQYEIVGVARDARDHELRGDVAPRFYVPATQSTEAGYALNLEIRTPDPAKLAKPLRETIRALDPKLLSNEPVPLSDLTDAAIENERIIAKLSTVFSLIALLLAAIGLFGVISYNVARRTNEIGIRMALGGARGDALRMVLKETLLLALAGIAVGVPLALTLVRLVSSHLFGLSPADPATLATAITILVLVAGMAAAVPGSRATRVQPVQALRYE